MRRPLHLVMVGAVLLLLSLLPVLVAFENWPWHFVAVLLSPALVVAAAIALGCLLELLRRGWKRHVFATMLLTVLAVLAWIYSFALTFANMAEF